MEPTVSEQVGQILSPPDTWECHVQDRRREKQDGLSENDRHDAGVVDFQRHVLSLTTIYLPADHTLRVLDADFPLGLRHGNDRCNHKDQEGNHQHKNNRAYRALSLGTGRNKCPPRLDQARRQLGENTHGDNDGHAVANAALRDLITKPHQQHGARCHGNDRNDVKTDSRRRNQGQTNRIDRVHDTWQEWVCLGVLKGTRQEVSLENAKPDRGISGVLHDFLTPTILAGKFSKLRNHSS